MKKLLVLTLLCVFTLAGLCPAHAGFFETYKAKIEKNRQVESTVAEISRLFEDQLKYCNLHDVDKLFEKYSPKYINADGFNKEIYRKMVKETWETYPDISYASKIKSVSLKDNFATVEILEVAVAAISGLDEVISAGGELTSAAKSTYYLEKTGGKWFITSEYVTEEKTLLRFGEARYVDMSLNSPGIINAGADYTATLKIDTPMHSIIVASIGQEKISYPLQRAEDIFRKLPDEEILERVFKANSDNVNEYNVASVGITRAQKVSDDEVKVYLSGLAFLMSRVNVIPKNNLIQIEAQDVKKAE